MRVCVHLQTQEMVHFSVTRQLAMCCCVWCVCAMYVLCLCPHPPNSLFFRSVLSLSVFLFSLFLLFVVFVVMLLLPQRTCEHRFPNKHTLIRITTD